MTSGRSYEAIKAADLVRLSEIAEADRQKFFRTRPEYRDRLVGTALGQGAALHYAAGVRGGPLEGIKDFDVWSFFAAIPGERFPADRRMTHADLGPSRFGRWEDEPPRFRHFTGRRVDLLMRALPVEPGADPAESLIAYLENGRTSSARALAAKAVVLIDPERVRGHLVWPAPSP